MPGNVENAKDDGVSVLRQAGGSTGPTAHLCNSGDDP
jgi:hypothetical protein